MQYVSRPHALLIAAVISSAILVRVAQAGPEHQGRRESSQEEVLSRHSVKQDPTKYFRRVVLTCTYGSLVIPRFYAPGSSK